jgi:hypothetical protein
VAQHIANHKFSPDDEAVTTGRQDEISLDETERITIF